MTWRVIETKEAEEWTCDICHECGDPMCCSPREMWQRGADDYAVCEFCKDGVVTEEEES